MEINNHISVVVGCNNNGYGSNVEKLYKVLSSMIQNFGEVIFVDWGSKVSFKTCYPDCFPISNKLHYHFVEGQDRFVEGRARNYGIRKAKNDWILCTNTDIVMSLESIIPDYLRKDTLYVAPRHDVPEVEWKRTLPKLTLGDFINWLYHQTFPRNIDWDTTSLVLGCGDFQLAHRDLWFKVRGYEEDFVKRNYHDTNLQLKVLNAGGMLSRLNYTCWHLNHKKPNKYLSRLLFQCNPKWECYFKRKFTHNSIDWGLWIPTN